MRAEEAVQEQILLSGQVCPVNVHLGHVQFQNFVEDEKQSYLMTSLEKKLLKIMRIINKIRNLNQQEHFLLRDANLDV